MSAGPLIHGYADAPPQVLLHLWAALAALVLGAFVLWHPKGDAPHRWLGRLWGGLMLAVAISSLFIQARGGYGPIHLFSLFVLVMLPRAVLAAWRGQMLRHRRGMQGLYVGLCIAGIFTLLPDRMLGRLVFG